MELSGYGSNVESRLELGSVKSSYFSRGENGVYLQPTFKNTILFGVSIGEGDRPPPGGAPFPTTEMVSISYSILEILAKLYVGTPSPLKGRLLHPYHILRLK